jgi:hypothetical protein
MTKILVATAFLFLLNGFAGAAKVSEELIQGNADVCATIAANPALRKLDPSLPSDSAKIPSHCRCVSNAYWDSVPQTDYEGMLVERRAGQMKGPYGVSIASKVHDRMTNARSSCKTN